MSSEEGLEVETGSAISDLQDALGEVQRVLYRSRQGELRETELADQTQEASEFGWRWSPFFRPASGFYQWQRRSGHRDMEVEANGESDDAAAFPLLPKREELRLDVDGRYPQMTVSGTIFASLTQRVHWIAKLTGGKSNQWQGTIWYKRGATSIFPYTNVKVRVVRNGFWSTPRAIITFLGGGLAPRTRSFHYRSPYSHPVEFEFDAAKGASPVTSIDTHAHPNRPAALPRESLTIEKVFRRAGYRVTKSNGDNIVPLSGAGSDARWSDMEMHDAMQVYWSRFANRAAWSMWVFFASLHERGTSLGGIMFDDIGPNHRQGTAVFNDSFIANAPSGDPAPAAWVQRMRFWTACHEMGHAFNLAHSWQKSLGTPWISLSDEPNARSFMNYPYGVSGGQTAFFADFEYRFSDMELLFLRHAPNQFVQMGNADWFDHHGFEQPGESLEPMLRLELRTNRDRPRFEFLEPPMLELKLTNLSAKPQTIDQNLLTAGEHLTVIIKKEGRPAKQFLPYARYCQRAAHIALLPGESVYESLFVAAGRGGWELSEPGNYVVQVALQRDGEDIVSNPLLLRIETPRNYEEERLAQDYFSDEVGRILTFDGSQTLQEGKETLREVAEKLSKRKVASHARVALGNSMLRDYKLLDLPSETHDELLSAAEAGGTIQTRRADPESAQKELYEALLEDADESAQSLGHIDYHYYVDRFCEWLADHDEREEAADAQDRMAKTLSARGVLSRVVEDIKNRRDMYRGRMSEGDPPAQRKKRAKR